MTAQGLSEALRGVLAPWVGCRGCGLSEGRTTQVWGRQVGEFLRGQIVFVGEAPGREEDETGIAFVGRSGKMLDRWIEGSKLRSAYIANTVACRPPRNRDPKRVEMKACWGRLYATIKAIRPKVLITIGRVSSHWLLDSDKSMGYLASRVFRLTIGEDLFFVLPIHHPSYILRTHDSGLENAIIERIALANRINDGKVLVQTGHC